MEDWIVRNGLKVVKRDRLRALSVKSDLKGGVQTVSHIGAIALTTTGLVLAGPMGLWALIPLLILHGMLINCLYAGQHELSHWTVFRTKGWNDVFGHVFGLATLNPFLTDRWAHFAHHRATQDPLKDSELIGMTPYTTARYILDLVAVDFWRRRIRSIVRAALGQGLDADYWLEGNQRLIVIWEARGHVAMWVLLAAGSVGFHSLAVLEFWLCPLLLTKVFHQLQNTGEHTCMPNDPDIFINTRTLTGPAPMRWIFWNMSYHTAHHAYPGVPFHALPALHQEIVAGLGRPPPTYGYLAAQREIFSRLKKSDAEARIAA